MNNFNIILNNLINFRLNLIKITQFFNKITKKKLFHQFYVNFPQNYNFQPQPPPLSSTSNPINSPHHHFSACFLCIHKQGF